MKRIYSILLILAISLSMTGCGNDKSQPNIEVPDEVVNSQEKEETIIKGDNIPTEVESVNLFDETLKEYTKDTLPENLYDIDFDSDNLTNKEEIDASTDMYKSDTDGDGIIDGDEIKETNTDPLKWSTRDDNISDLEYSIINKIDFEASWTATDANGFKVYLANPEDQLYLLGKVSINTFDSLETISEVYQIKNFSGKIALDVSKYIEEVAESIAIYKDKNNTPEKLEVNITEDRLVEFNVEDGDGFVAIYEPINKEN